MSRTSLFSGSLFSGSRFSGMRLLQAAGATALLAVSLGATTGGCLNRPIDRINPRTTSTVVERLLQSGVDKIDLLLAVDNSISMADKQQILAAAVPDLVNRLVTPNCVDEAGLPTGQTVDPAGECPDGSKPEFPPIRNINVGIISSSLGDLTSGACASATVVHPDDQAHLLTRAPSPVNTYKDQGFLAWDPDGKRDPAGEGDAAALAGDLTNLVIGVDQVGCGYEMQMESILRFLVDPDPYASVVEDPPNYLKEVDTDTVVLEQRKNFLRPDSLLAIIILSDENDCSIDIGGQGFLALGAPFFRATSECDTAGPQDECCSSCGLPIAAGCDAGNSCDSAKYTTNEDHPNLKCYRQKERYGVNFLYPVARYVNAFTQPNIDPTKRDYAADDPANAVDNPIFSDLTGGTGTIRSPDLVFVAGIVGVPWQAIARRDGSDQPDLSLGFKTFGELEPDLEALIGDPDTALYPTDPFMIESVAKRSGSSALTGESPNGANSINGNDYNVSTTAPNDLQYACIFPLVTPVPNGPDCDDCIDTATCDKPLCDIAGTSTTQINAKAYPGLRELSFLRGMGPQGIFASICPAEVDDTGSPIYGYRPAVNTIIDRLKEELGGQCLPRELTVDEKTEKVPCLVIEAVVAGSASCCSDVGGRVDIPKTLDDGVVVRVGHAAVAAQNSDFANPDWNCFCEITQLTGDEQETCQTDPDPQSTAQSDGWCYIAATDTQQVGDPALVAACPDTERRLVRFVGEGDPRIGSTVIVTCSGE